MAVAQLILAVLVGLVALGLFLVAQFSAWRVRVHRHLVHDISGTLGIVRMARYLGNEEGLDAGLNVLAAYVQPEKLETVRLRKLLQSLLGLFEVPRFCKIDWHLDGNVQVRIQPKIAHALFANLLHNATEAACEVPYEAREPILVSLDDRRLVISNVASQASRDALTADPGSSTKGPGRGIGRQSVVRCCELLGWKVHYKVEGRCVITTIDGFVPASECATLASGEDDHE